jgi:glycosyltransferase involved in cell wall biosynthesis
LRAEIDQMVGESEVSGRIAILAGPLTTVTAYLVGLDARLVGLSWGWDLQPEAIGQPFDADALAWVGRLDALIVDSVVTRAVAERLGLKSDRISLIPWGIDPKLFTPDGPKADLSAWGVSPGDRAVLSLRSHTPVHRVGDIIEAFARAREEDPSLFLLVGGDGPLLEQHVARVAEMGIGDRVRFIGILPETELPGLLRAVDVYVSATAVDGTSVTLLQALATGTPAVVSDIPGNRPWLEHGLTATFPTTDVQRLGMRILRPPRRSSDVGQPCDSVSNSDLPDWARGGAILKSTLCEAAP